MIELAGKSRMACAAAFAGFLFATSLPVNAALLVLTFALAAPLHPIVSARAYAALPGRSSIQAASRGRPTVSPGSA